MSCVPLKPGFAAAASGYFFLTGGTVYNWQMLMMSLMLLIPAAIFYGLVYLLAILLRGSIHTGAAGLGVLLLFTLWGGALNYYWQIELPGWGVLFAWIIQETGEFPALSVAGGPWSRSPFRWRRNGCLSEPKSKKNEPADRSRPHLCRSLPCPLPHSSLYTVFILSPILRWSVLFPYPATFLEID